MQAESEHLGGQVAGAETSVAPTLSAVARMAGVSPITVSRVVRQPDIVSEATRLRVQAAMRELAYVPNQVAGALASARTRSVGVLVPTIANSIFADTVQGVSDVLEPLGFSVILAQSGYDAAREDKMLAALLSRRPEAIIMVGAPATAAGAELLRRARIPVVETWELPVTPIDAAAGFDNSAAGAAVGRHFVASGRRQLAFVGGGDRRAMQRFHGFCATACSAGLDEPPRVLVDHRAGGAAAGVAVLTAVPNLDAVFAANDSYAIGVLSALRAAGRLPAGPVSEPPVAVVGLADLEVGRLFTPAVSTIRIDGAAIGRAAAELALDPARPRRVDLGFELVLRESG
jgi:LacI family transcriptional regulator, gluconate utilization system Gnt-I transcriptional repressor